MNIVLFDGVCNLCSASVLFLMKYDKSNNLHFATQQNESGKNIMQTNGIKEDHNSVVFIKNKTLYFKSDAIIEIAKHLTGWPRIIKYFYFIPKIIRDCIYDIIAKNRHRIFGKKKGCFIPTKAQQIKFL